MKYIHPARALSAALASLLLLTPAASSLPGYSPTVTVMVDTDGTDAASLLSHLTGAELLNEYSIIDTFSATVREDQLPLLNSLPGVLSVSPETTFTAPRASGKSLYGPADIDMRDQVIRAEDPHTGEGSVIAILDTGFDVTHPSFAMPKGISPVIEKEDIPTLTKDTYVIFRQTREKIEETYVSAKIPFAYDYADTDTDVYSDQNHGTHVAATAAGSGDLYGAAPGAQLLLMKVFADDTNTCDERTLLMAIEDAVKLGADVINLSLGTISMSSTYLGMGRLAGAIRGAQSKGVTVICAVGNDGRAGSGGAASDFFRATDPDYGLLSEPAVIDGTVAVGAAVNRIIYAGYVELGGRKMVYDYSNEMSLGQIPTFSDVLGGLSLPLTVVGGVGRESDYENLSVRGHIVLIRRGEISFEEKIKIAAKRGAIGAIIYDPNKGGDSFLMQVGADSPIPAVSVGYADGEYLSRQNGKRITVSEKEGAFPAAARGVASYSAWGSSSDLTLKPDISAVGSYVISAAVGGGYSVMSGTSMATPQITGMAAAFIAENREMISEMDKSERPGFVKAALMSRAEPLLYEDGIPYSPRGQGAGVLRTLPGDVLLTAEDGRGSLVFGDQNTGVFPLALTLSNRGDKTKTITLRCETITDHAVEQEGVWYVDGTPEQVPATTRVELNDRITMDEDGHILCTLEAGESTSVYLEITVDPAYMESHGKIFTNGFYLEGYVIAEEDGVHEASVPFLSFAGDWTAAPAVDGGDWDGYESYYGNQNIHQEMTGPSVIAGLTDEGVLSELFMFSPDGDGDADQVFWTIYPLRHIEECTITVYSENGDKVYENVGYTLPKSYVDDGNLLHTILHLWDGSDGFNEKFIWQDGRYVIEVRLTSFSGGTQTVSIPMQIDTEKPRITSLAEEDGVLYAAVSDNGYLREVRIYLPTGSDSYAVNEILTPDYDKNVHTAEIAAELPTDAEYVYVRAEDYAGNVTVVRHYLR